MKTIVVNQQGVWRTWWRKQSPVRQDRYAMIAPIVTVLLFLSVVFISIAYLRFEEADREQELIKRDMDFSQTQLRERLQERKEQIFQIARDAGRGLVGNSEFLSLSETLIATSPELQALIWIDADKKFRSAYITTNAYTTDWAQSTGLERDSESRELYQRVQVQKQALYSDPYLSSDSRGLMQLQVPILSPNNTNFYGVLLAEISLDSLLQYGAPEDIKKRYGLAFVNSDHQRLAGSLSKNSKLSQTPLAWIFGANAVQEITSDFEINEMDRTPVEGDAPLRLVLQGYRTSQGFTGSGLRYLVGALSLLTIWMLIANWRHTRRRLRTQDALLAETNFRRAMENSIPTGMRALDIDGQITYVNKAFCEMTGWREADLVGTKPPYVYWPHEDIPKLTETLMQELNGDTNPAGIEMQVLRRNGSRFAARMYVSPLIDAKGVQTGWMAAMTDITEPRRIRQELSASYDRFTTILEGLDASISVSTMGSKELLFANKTFRNWFGENTRNQPVFVDRLLAKETSHSSDEDVDDLAGLPLADLENAPSESQEIYVEDLDRWLEVRVRYLNWVDGHLAQMVIAGDITARRNAESQAAEQAERAQSASRLITMGEMASSVAHELNQPLAAITNYCSGMTSRLQNQPINAAEILQAVEKTSKQAQRAGQIIQRIRNFVKRSEPNRTLSSIAHMVSEAVELAGIEVGRRKVTLNYYLEPNLPNLLVDPILIEQVIINLIKNAAEAIDQAARPFGLRQITLRAISKESTVDALSKRGVEFSVQDTGGGVPTEVIDRIFDAFFSTKAEGMGIGLNLCRSIVESHQGRLTVENLYNSSQEITGCRFSFWLPIHLPLKASS
jgi:PAS domain S-box-containing protein